MNLVNRLKENIDLNCIDASPISNAHTFETLDRRYLLMVIHYTTIDVYHIYVHINSSEAKELDWKVEQYKKFAENKFSKLTKDCKTVAKDIWFFVDKIDLITWYI